MKQIVKSLPNLQAKKISPIAKQTHPTQHNTIQYEWDFILIYKFTWWLHIFLNNTSAIYCLFLLWETQQKKFLFRGWGARVGGVVVEIFVFTWDNEMGQLENNKCESY